MERNRVKDIPHSCDSPFSVSFTPTNCNTCSHPFFTTTLYFKFPGVSCRCYADDTHMYLSFTPDAHAQQQSVTHMEICVNYVREWMLLNKLMLNDSKTELSLIGTSKQISKLSFDGIWVRSSVIKSSSIVRNLGVCFDTHLNREAHITNVCKSSYHMIYNLRRIRKYFDENSMKMIVQACIVSKMDYCNGLL